MSEKFDKHRQIRLTPENLRKLKKTQEAYRAKVSIASLANAAISAGISELLQPSQPQTKS